MKKREDLLSKHPYKIYQGKDGRWYTYLPGDDTRRKLIKRNSKKDIEDKVISYWKKETENPTVKELFYEWINQKLEYQDICKETFDRCDRLGIKRKSPHKLRKTYVSILLDNGIDKRLVQDVAGHTEIATSERSYHRNRKSDQKKEEILSNIPEFKNAQIML